MIHSEMLEIINSIFTQVKETHTEGQKEYADDSENVFANFKRVADRLDIDKQEVLLVYMLKHIDGICSFVKGHKSQREDVRGRITDAIVYLCILWGMIEDEGEEPEEEKYVHKLGYWESRSATMSKAPEFTEDPDNE